MIWIIGLGLFVFIAAVKEIFFGKYRMTDNLLEKLFGGFFSLILAAVGAFAGLVIAVIIGAFLPMDWSEPETYDLVSLNQAAGVEGHFFLGSGQISSSQYYYFYWKDGEAYHPDQVKANPSVSIYQEDRIDGQLSITQYEFAEDWYFLIGIPVKGKASHAFHIPEGSIKEGFNLP